MNTISLYEWSQLKKKNWDLGEAVETTNGFEGLGCGCGFTFIADSLP